MANNGNAVRSKKWLALSIVAALAGCVTQPAKRGPSQAEIDAVLAMQPVLRAAPPRMQQPRAAAPKPQPVRVAAAHPTASSEVTVADVSPPAPVVPVAAPVTAPVPGDAPVVAPQRALAPAPLAVASLPSEVAFCTRLQEIATASAKEAVPYGNAASFSEECPRWRKFPSVAARTAAQTGDNLNEIADLFSEKGYLVRMRFTTPSGEWIDQVDYCFRPDKTLAAVHAELRTVSSNLIVERRWLYDPAGRKSEIPRVYRTLTTGELTTSRGPSGIGYQDHPVPEYLRMLDLPWNPDSLRRELRICSLPVVRG